MLEVGLSTCGYLFTEENFKSLANAGIKNIEISRGWQEYKDFNFSEIKRLTDKYSITLWSFHLPFADPNNLDISSLNEKIRQSTVNWWCENIKKGAEIGIKIFVAHPSSEPISEDPKIRKQNIEAAKKSLKELAEFAAQFDAVIAVEDLPRSCLGRNAFEIFDLISADKRLKVCLDTNHMLEDRNLNLIKTVGDKIVTLHVSDYDFVNERHWLPGEGKNDWQELYSALIEIGYTGVWMYELGLVPSENSPIKRPRPLTFKDFHDNAMQIFQNEPFALKD